MIPSYLRAAVFGGFVCTLDFCGGGGGSFGKFVYIEGMGWDGVCMVLRERKESVRTHPPFKAREGWSGVPPPLELLREENTIFCGTKRREKKIFAQKWK